MKKTLIALVVLTVTGTAFSQSSLTLYGIVDANLAIGKGSVSNRTQLSNSGLNNSRIGFRGTEDLGGGLSASFWLEAGLNNDNGTGAATNVNNQTTGSSAQGLTFNRRSTVSLAGSMGELRLGRDYTPQFWNMPLFDPFFANGIGTTQIMNSLGANPVSARASNSIGYFLPGNLGGFYGQVNYYLGENPSNVGVTEDDGNGYGARIGYARGRLNIALAMSKTNYTTANGINATGDVKQRNFGGQWNFGVARLMWQLASDSVGTAKGRGAMVGGVIPLGASEIRLSLSRYRLDVPVGADRATSKFAVGYSYNLSKRTAVYGTLAKLSNSGDATQSLNGAVTAPGGSSRGMDIGIRHSF